MFLRPSPKIKNLVVPPNKPILFIGEGQSNKSGNGANTSSLASLYPLFSGILSDIYVFNPNTNLFETVNVGVNNNLGSDLTSLKFGTELPFSVLARDYLGVKIHYVKTSVGSTGITNDPAGLDWLPSNNELFLTSNNRILSAIAQMNLLYGLGGWIFSHASWMQGEDERFDTANYSGKLKTFIDAKRVALSFRLPYVIGRVSVSNGIYLEQLKYIKTDRNSWMADAVNYTYTDGLHFDSATMYALAVREFEICKSFIWR